MPWLLLDILIGLGALAGLAAVLLGLWRRVKELGRELGRASAAVGRATDDLASAQSRIPDRSSAATGPAGFPLRP